MFALGFRELVFHQSLYKAAFKEIMSQDFVGPLVFSSFSPDYPIRDQLYAFLTFFGNLHQGVPTPQLVTYTGKVTIDHFQTL